MKREVVAGIELLHRPGPGPTLVLLHGIGSDAVSWAPMIEALPARLDVIAWWAPGYGESAPVAPERPAPADYAARLLALLDAMGRDRVVLAGHSLGALFAGAFTARHPDRVAELALFSVAQGYRVPPGQALPAAAQARIDDLAALGPAAFAARRAGNVVHRPAALEGVRRAMAAVRLPGYAQAVHALAQGDLLADAEAITRLRPRPVRLMYGEQDRVTPPSGAARLMERLPVGSTLRILPDCGHALPQEAPQEAAALIAELADG